MDPQEAIEAPRVGSWSFPNSFWPHAYHPGLASAEGRIDREVIVELVAKGHRFQIWEDWTSLMGSPCAIQIDPDTGELRGGADPRLDGSAMGR